MSVKDVIQDWQVIHLIDIVLSKLPLGFRTELQDELYFLLQNFKNKHKINLKTRQFEGGHEMTYLLSLVKTKNDSRYFFKGQRAWITDKYKGRVRILSRYKKTGNWIGVWMKEDRVKYYTEVSVDKYFYWNKFQRNVNPHEWNKLKSLFIKPKNVSK